MDLCIQKLPVKSKSDVEEELSFHVVETNQPGLLGLSSSQNLGLIKVVMTGKTEREETTTDNSSETTKTSQELKEEVFQKHAQVFKSSCNNTSRTSRESESRVG